MVLVVAHCDKKATFIRAAKIDPPTGHVASTTVPEIAVPLPLRRAATSAVHPANATLSAIDLAYLFEQISGGRQC
jgi:hypothetical protein